MSKRGLIAAAKSVAIMFGMGVVAAVFAHLLIVLTSIGLGWYGFFLVVASCACVTAFIAYQENK